MIAKIVGNVCLCGMYILGDSQVSADWCEVVVGTALSAGWRDRR